MRRDLGAVVAAVAVVAGVLTGERLGPGTATGAAVLAVVAVAGGLVWRRRRAAAAASTVVVLVLAGTASMQRALDGLDGPVAHLAAEEPEAVLRVQLVDDPRGSESGARAVARLVELETLAAGDEVLGPAAGEPGGPVSAGRGSGVEQRQPGRGSLIVVRARGATASRIRLLDAGDVAVVSGRLRPLEGPERRLRWRHAVAAFEAADLHAAGRPRSPARRVANAVRTLVLRGVEPLPDPQRSLVAGFLVGDDRAIPREVVSEFRAAGLSHLLAVSGANVALVLALARPALDGLDLAGRLVGGVGVIAVFATMTRFEPSVLRASTMAGLALVAGYLGRPASGLRLLALAATALILADPFLVRSVGFQLSCGASAGIVLLARPFSARLPGPGWAREAMAVTAAAQLGAAPAALPAFGALPLVALPANLVVAPAAAALTIWGLPAGFLGGVLLPWLPDVTAVLALPTLALAGYVAGVADAAAHAPGAVGLPTLSGAAAAATLAAARSRITRPRGRPAVRDAALGRARPNPDR